MFILGIMKDTAAGVKYPNSYLLYYESEANLVKWEKRLGRTYFPLGAVSQPATYGNVMQLHKDWNHLYVAGHTVAWLAGPTLTQAGTYSAGWIVKLDLET
jgi:hypothetical protein